MSTWISEAGRAGGIFALLLGAAGCGAVGQYPPQVELGPPRFVVAAPSGFCVDPAASRIAERSATVFLADCAVLAGRKREGSVLLAVTVAPAPPEGTSPPDPARAAEALGRIAARAALSRSGRAETVTVISATPEDGTLFLALADSAPFPGGAVDPEYRRAFAVVAGRTVSVAAYAPKGGAPATSDLDAVLRAALGAVRAANRG